MRHIRLSSITKRKGSGSVLKGVNLEIPDGKFFALLGPSGCGKTTLLRLIAGLEKSDAGTIFLGQQNITNLSARERNINIVFQNYALFPHLNTYDNIAYSLNLKKVPKVVIKKRVHEIIKSFHLDQHIFKYPKELSGGQQQRVAIARAIVNEPDVLLLDEPLAALDFKLREKLLVELIDLQVKLKTTFVYVTHDQFEALTVADTMAIMNHNGEIEQIGTPEQIYEFPTSTFVAKFVGTTNIFKGIHTRDKDISKIEIPGLGHFKVFVGVTTNKFLKNKMVAMSIRPEKIFISKCTQKNFDNQLKGYVSQIIYHGRSTQYNVIVNNTFQVQVFEQNEEHFADEDIDYDDEVFLYWQAKNALILEK